MAQTENSVTAYDVEDWKNKGRIQMSPAERESWLNEGQLLLTDYAEGIEREWELIKFYSQLLAAVADWCIVFLKAHMVRSGRTDRNLIISADGSNTSRRK
ncbi:MAG: hypothetical protein ACLSFF_14005 [Roseburia intestinalis]